MSSYTEHRVAGRQTWCDEYGPLGRCPCSIEAIRQPGHEPHWWTTHYPNAVYEMNRTIAHWCGGSLDQDWRELIDASS